MFVVVIATQPIILDNLVSTMKYVVTGMRLLNIEFQFSKNKVCFVVFLVFSIDNPTTFSMTRNWPRS